MNGDSGGAYDDSSSSSTTTTTTTSMLCMTPKKNLAVRNRTAQQRPGAADSPASARKQRQIDDHDDDHEDLDFFAQDEGEEEEEDVGTLPFTGRQGPLLNWSSSSSDEEEEEPKLTIPMDLEVSEEVEEDDVKKMPPAKLKNRRRAAAKLALVALDKQQKQQQQREWDDDDEWGETASLSSSSSSFTKTRRRRRGTAEKRKSGGGGSPRNRNDGRTTKRPRKKPTAAPPPPTAPKPRSPPPLSLLPRKWRMTTMVPARMADPGGTASTTFLTVAISWSSHEPSLLFCQSVSSSTTTTTTTTRTGKNADRHRRRPRSLRSAASPPRRKRPRRWSETDDLDEDAESKLPARQPKQPKPKDKPPPAPQPPSPPSKQVELFRHNLTAYATAYDTHVEELAYHVYADEPDRNGDGTTTTPMMKPPEHFDLSMLLSHHHNDNIGEDGSSSSPVTWSYEPTNRIVRVDFTAVPSHQPLPIRDLERVAQLMQRDDLVVITKGLTMQLPDPEKVERLLQYLGGSEHLFHKFRRFQRRKNGPLYPDSFDEMDGHVAMMPQAFVNYLDHRQNGPADATVTFQLLNGTCATVGVHDVLLYMIDADVPQLYPQLEEAYRNELRWSAIYPGGSLCMMKDLPGQMQPFMGPNLYVTPGNTFTTLHQDGLGTVDSGHSCLYGTNEVFMLRRLPEIHKRQACAMVPSMTKGVSAVDQCENTLYGLPHDDFRADKQKWPTNQLVEQWRALNYCPSVFILKAGEHLHINKGRLHSFRKMSREPLPDDDCHASLRADHLESHPIQLDVCISIAFDWMFLGADAQGINREVATILENAGRIRTRKGAKTLAIVETSVFGMAEAVVRTSLTSDELPRRLDIAKGLLPALEVLKQPVHMVDANTLSPVLQSSHNASLLYGVELVPTNRLPDADQPYPQSMEPYDSGDYTCKLCDTELANLYYHCEGCDLLLRREYNICKACFATGAFLQYTPMRYDALKVKFSHLHHTGQTTCDHLHTECGCKQGACAGCSTPNPFVATPIKSRCRKCSCKCHKKFSARYRFRDDTETMALVRNVERVAGEEKIKYYSETMERIKGVRSALELPLGR